MRATMLKNPKDHNYLLKYADEHVGYEIDLFCATSLLIGRLSTGNKSLDTFIEFALLESFLLHMRNLIDFLYPRNKRNDDVTINDYLDSETLTRTLPKITTNIEAYRFRADKELAHLTTKRRFSMKGKEWLFVQIRINILELFNKILPDLAKGKFSYSLVERINKHIEKSKNGAIEIHAVSNTTTRPEIID